MAVRVDLGRLRPAKQLPDGRMLFDAFITRAGIFEYPQKDGSVKRELRPPEEVFSKESMDSFAMMPATNHHPPKLLDTDTARDYMVGATDSTVLRDDDHLRTQVMVTDSVTINAMKRYPEVSCGYKCDIVEKGGVHPVYGRYDAVQTNIRGNHLGLAVPVARAGSSVRVRFDAARHARFDAADCAVAHVDAFGSLSSNEYLSAAQVAGATVMLTDIVEGHQHTVDTTYFTDGIGNTNWSTMAGADDAHGHAVIKNSDGTYAVAWSAGHSHALVVADGQAVYDSADRTDNNPGDHVPTNDKTAAMAQQLAAAEARAAAAEGKLSSETARADAAEGRVDGLEKDIKELRATRQDAAVIVEKDEQIAKLQKRADAAERALTDVPARIKTGVSARVRLEREAAPIMVGKDGAEFKMDSLSDREIMVSVIERVHGVAVEKERSDEFARGRFDSAVESWKAGAAVLARITEQAPAQIPIARNDAQSASPVDAWKKPLPSSKFKEG